MKIGIFDSGIGGVSVLNEAYHYIPEAEYIFYADVDHVPYGIRTPEEITGYVDEIVDNLIGRGSDVIVIACNTATSVAASFVRSKYELPIIGIEPAVKPAVETAMKTKERVLVMATPVTIRENKLKTLLSRVDKTHVVDLLPMPGLVRFAEAEKFDDPEVDAYIEEQLAVYNKSVYSEVVLGCTHFNYFKPAIAEAFGSTGKEVELVDGNEGTVRHLAELLQIDAEFDPDIDIEDFSNRTIYLQSGREAGEADRQKYIRLHRRLEMIRNY